MKRKKNENIREIDYAKAIFCDYIHRVKIFYKSNYLTSCIIKNIQKYFQLFHNHYEKHNLFY